MNKRHGMMLCGILPRPARQRDRDTFQFTLLPSTATHQSVNQIIYITLGQLGTGVLHLDSRPQ